VLTAAGLAGCATTSSTQTIRGHLVADERITLPPDGLMVVELRDAAADQVLTEQRQPQRGLESPLPFQLQLPRDRLQPGQRLEVRGALLSQGWAQWLSAPVAIDASAEAIDVGALRLQRAPRPLAFQTQIDCGTRRFSIGLHGDTMRLLDGDAFYDLREVPAPVGSRLEAIGDPSTFVQSEGRQATVGLRGVVYGDCSLSR
jgi:Type III secretion system lipoprotein chaperone (YscW)